MANGRFTNKSIAEDDRLGKLSAMAEFIFLKTIPHLDRDGMITGKPGLLFSKTHPLREELFGQTQTFIDEWVAVGLAILFNTTEGPALFFPGFAKNNRLPHYEREQPSRYPPPPGWARGDGCGLYPAHKSPPAKAPKKPKESPPPLVQELVQELVQDDGMDEVQDGILDEVRELLQDTVQTLVDEVPFLEAEVEVKDQVKDQGKRRETTTTNARVLVNFAAALLLPEWNGGGVYLESLNDEELIILSSWLWLHRKLKGGSAYARNVDAERYKVSPFAGVTNDCGFIRSKVAERTQPLLHFAHRAEFEAALRALQEAQP